MVEDQAKAKPPAFVTVRALSVWAIASCFYLYEFVVRVAPGVMETSLQRDLDASAGELATALGAYYYIYAPMQLIVGLLMDRIGAKRLILGATCFVVGGCFLEAYAQDLDMLAMGRMLQGLGSAFAYVGAVYLNVIWFPHRKLALMIGLTASLGMLGAITGNAGIVALVEAGGWRWTLHLIAWAGLGLLVLIWLVIPPPSSWEIERKKAHPEKHPFKALSTNLKIVLINYQTWIIGFVGACLYLPLIVFGALWGDNYVMKVSAVDKGVAASAVSMLYVGWLVGAPLTGWLSDKVQRRKPFFIFSTLGMGALFLGMLAFSHIPIVFMFFLLFAAGLFSCLANLTMVTVLGMVPGYASGTAMASVNMMIMLLGSIFQPLSGYLLGWKAKGIDPSDYTNIDYRIALSVLPLMAFIGFLVSLLLKEKS